MSTAADDAGVKSLLSLQVPLDLCGTLDNPARAWAKSATTSRLRLSVLTVALARSIVNGATRLQTSDFTQLASSHIGGSVSATSSSASFMAT